jgi:hypothetical protein
VNTLQDFEVQDFYRIFFPEFFKGEPNYSPQVGEVSLGEAEP